MPKDSVSPYVRLQELQCFHRHVESLIQSRPPEFEDLQEALVKRKELISSDDILAYAEKVAPLPDDPDAIGFPPQWLESRHSFSSALCWMRKKRESDPIPVAEGPAVSETTPLATSEESPEEQPASTPKVTSKAPLEEQPTSRPAAQSDVPSRISFGLQTIVPTTVQPTAQPEARAGTQPPVAVAVQPGHQLIPQPQTHLAAEPKVLPLPPLRAFLDVESHPRVQPKEQPDATTSSYPPRPESSKSSNITEKGSLARVSVTSQTGLRPLTLQGAASSASSEATSGQVPLFRKSQAKSPQLKPVESPSLAESRADSSQRRSPVGTSESHTSDSEFEPDEETIKRWFTWWLNRHRGRQQQNQDQASRNISGSKTLQRATHEKESSGSASDEPDQETIQRWFTWWLNRHRERQQQGQEQASRNTSASRVVHRGNYEKEGSGPGSGATSSAQSNHKTRVVDDTRVETWRRHTGGGGF